MATFDFNLQKVSKETSTIKNIYIIYMKYFVSDKLHNI